MVAYGLGTKNKENDAYIKSKLLNKKVMSNVFTFLVFCSPEKS
jgi:hypothetical protein